jgi:capsular exopolysaccharide synthesis family protein
VTWQRKPSLLAESFRATLASLLFAGDDAGVLVITSPGAREGKTTTTTNLAIALADTKRRVLLIDGDMRRPRQHAILEVSNSWGLSDALQESNPIQSYPWEGLTRETSVPNLWMLPSGPGVVSASNLLYSPRLTQLLDRAKKAFDLILIDTPPMLDLPDARILGQAASGVILVLRAGRTTRETALAARMRLEQDNTRIVGTILNDWNPQGGAYKHYYKRYWQHLRAEAAG